MSHFNVPVVLFMFKRDKAVEIVKRIAQVKPKKLYLMADYGRNEQEKRQADECRRMVENEITWECEVIKNYAEENRGVYENIGEGAMWVLRREKWAIFLEDDNLPEVTFFDFCREMLERYEEDTRVLWICGTNYLGDYNSSSGDSYVFTRHMLPCGWASWGSKFERFYDGKLNLINDSGVMNNIGDVYLNKSIYKQYRNSWMSEYCRIKDGKRPISWDYQMDFSIKAHNLVGICPCKNQIKNIGVDENSIHGGTSFSNIMTKRFCGMNSYSLEFPLQHPKTLLIDKAFEKAIGRIILYPLRVRIYTSFFKFIRKILRIPPNITTKQYIANKMGRKVNVK